MAIFLLLYVLLVVVWLSWSATITYVLLKYRYPDDIGMQRLWMYWGVCGFFVVVSIFFIARADWVTVPAFLSSMGV